MNIHFQYRFAKPATLSWLMACALIIGSSFQQEVLGDELAALAIKDAKIVTAPGNVIEKGTIVIRKGLIESVGADVTIPFDAKVIDGSGKVVYAGFIDSGTNKGIPEGDESGRVISSGEDRRDIDLATQIVAATREVNRKGIYPDYTPAKYLKLADDDARTWRKMGFTNIHVMPGGELLNGSSVFLGLNNPNQTALRDRILVEDFATIGGWRAGGNGYPRSLMGTVAHLRQTFLDAQHYQKSWEIYRRVGRGIPRPPRDLAMEALGRCLRREMPVIFPASNVDEINRAYNLSREFGFDLIIDGGQQGYDCLKELKRLGTPVILRINFADKPKQGESTGGRFMFGRRFGGGNENQKVDKRIPVAKGVLEDRIKKWEREVGNPAELEKQGIPFVFSTNSLSNPADFVEKLRLAIEQGLSTDEALRALTVRPAKLFGLQDQLGTVETGKMANLVVMDGDMSEEKTKVQMTIVEGQVFEHKDSSSESGRGARGGPRGRGDRPRGKGGAKRDTKRPASDASAEGSESEKKEQGQDDGDKDEDKADDQDEIKLMDWPIETDESRIPKTKTAGNVLIKNATVITAKNGTLPNTSILIQNGVITKIGPNLAEPEGTTLIDGTGAWVMPGIIDCHSHMVAGGNEGTLSVTPEVRTIDNMRSSDLTVYRAAAGGVTAANVLHGSANTIGGQRIVIQMKYKAGPSELLFKDFKPGIKFALGENVIRNENRYPNTRMGVESVLRLSFEEALRYKQTWARYNGLSEEEKLRTLPPRRDLRLEALQQVLDNELLVHCHCYNSGEILMLLKTFTRYGIKNLTLEHGLEAFKVAPEIVSFGENGAHLSTFADFWGYKVEAYDAIPYNVAVIHAAGGIAILNSDSGERVRRLNHDAAKMVRWGGISYQDAIRTITLNPAIALQLDDRVGSIEVGKKADLALFNGHPLNTFSRCFMTLIDGEVVFERAGERGGPYPLTEKSGFEASMPKINDKGLYVIQNALIHPVDAPPIANGTLIIKDGKIAAVGGTGVAVPDGATIVDGSNLQVYPGLIDGGNTVANSDLGLSDAGEQGDYKPSLAAASAIKPDSPLVGIARFTGLTCSVTVPNGGIISGQSAVVQMDGWNFDEMAFVDKLALEMTLPPKDNNSRSRGRRRGFGRSQPQPENENRPKPELTPYETVEKMFADAREYDRIRKQAKELGKPGPAFDADLDALVPFALKQKPVVVRVRSATQILDALEFARELDLRIILRDSGTESWKVADEIAEAGVPILIGATTQSVSDNYDPYDAVYSLPAKLHRAGVLFAFYTNSNTSARDLPLSAGIAVAYGLPKEEAIKALTSNTAKIFGLESQMGTLTVGKRADIIITDRSPLQATSNVIHMFINGKPVDVDDNMHTDLYKKYMRRIKRASQGTR